MPILTGRFTGIPVPLKESSWSWKPSGSFPNSAKCLIAAFAGRESFGKRVIFENDDFTVVLPFFVEYPYGVYIVSKNHKQNLTQMEAGEKRNLAKAIRETAGMLDALFDTPFPYMMCMHQNPVNTQESYEDYHFHIEFFPPMRSREKRKFNASSETGAWVHCNTTAPEEKAED